MFPKQKISVYVHFPFCMRKCPYCDFVSYDSSNTDHAVYIDAILKEFDTFAGRNLDITGVYIGGGTPSLMSPALVDKLIYGIKSKGQIASHAEITIEVNPTTADVDEMAEWRRSGVNRISLGIQSTDPETLRTLGRIHTAEEGRLAYEFARKVNFNAVSVDLIFGIPGRTSEEWMHDLDRVIEWKPDHVSAYILKPPDDWETPPAEEVSGMYLATVRKLEAAGLMQYEVSNFAREGMESRHNKNYWTMGNYLGLGVAAHSYMRDFSKLPDVKILSHQVDSTCQGAEAIRWWNVIKPENYIELVSRYGYAVEDAESIDENRDFDERLLLGLRLCEGLDTRSVSPAQLAAIRSIEPQLVRDELAALEHDRLKLTSKGLLLADEIAAKIATYVLVDVLS